MKGKGTAFGLRIKSAKVRGGVMQNIYFHDSDMVVKAPFYCDLNWLPSYSYPPPPKDIPEAQWPPHWKAMLTPVTPPERGIPEVGHIWVENITTTCGTAFSVNAYPEKPIHDVSFKNVTINAGTGGVIKNAANWTMTNVILHSKSQVKLEDDTNVALPTLESPVSK
jgi:polygalacturonase